MFVNHPALDTPEVRANTHIGYESVTIDRQGVTDVWTDPEVKALVRELGIELISYADIKKAK